MSEGAVSMASAPSSRSESSSDGLLSSHTFQEVWKQFALDAPRIDMYLDGRLLNETNPMTILSRLEEALRENPKELLTVCEFCVQTKLASFYSTVHDLLPKDNVHLVDGGRQTVFVSSKDSPRRLRVEKPFRVVDFGQSGSEDHRVLFVCTLVVYVDDLESGNSRHEWERSTVVDQDWVYVDDDFCTEEFAQGENGGSEKLSRSAEQIADVVKRRRELPPANTTYLR